MSYIDMLENLTYRDGEKAIPLKSLKRLVKIMESSVVETPKEDSVESCSSIEWIMDFFVRSSIADVVFRNSYLNLNPAFPIVRSLPPPDELNQKLINEILWKESSDDIQIRK